MTDFTFFKAWGKCLYTGTQTDIEHSEWKIPKDLKKRPFLKKWKFDKVRSSPNPPTYLPTPLSTTPPSTTHFV